MISLTETDLVVYCEREGVPFTVFDGWESILATTKDVLSVFRSFQDVPFCPNERSVTLKRTTALINHFHIVPPLTSILT